MAVIFIEVEAIATVDANVEEIESIAGAVSAKDNTCLVPLVNDQWHLVGKITEAGGLSETGLKVALPCRYDMVTAACEDTLAVNWALSLVPVVVAWISAQWITKSGCSTGGLG